MYFLRGKYNEATPSFAICVHSIFYHMSRCQIFNEFDNWNYVVSAVTLSSAFLAYADFFYVHSKFYSDCCDMAEKFISVRSKRIEKEKSITEDICEKVVGGELFSFLIGCEFDKLEFQY